MFYKKLAGLVSGWDGPGPKQVKLCKEVKKVGFGLFNSINVLNNYYIDMITCSGGMNGYISVPAGDPYPRIFRSPIDGMEDIMDNEVMYANFKLIQSITKLIHAYNL